MSYYHNPFNPNSASHIRYIEIPQRCQDVIDSDSPKINSNNRHFLEKIKAFFLRHGCITRKQYTALRKFEAKARETVSEEQKELQIKAKETPEFIHLTSLLKEELNSYQKKFVVSLRRQILDGRILSDNQKRYLEIISHEFSPKMKKINKEFADNYDNIKRAVWQACFRFYSKTPFYQSIIKNAEEKLSSRYVPPRVDYVRLCENDYSQNISDAITKEPKHSMGSMVLLRESTVRIRKLTGQKNPRSPLVVVGYDRKNFVSSAKGCLLYKLIQFGEMHPVFVEERYIKRFPKSLR